MQSYETGDPFAEQGPDRVRREVRVPRVVAGPQQMSDVVHQARDLEFLVGGATSAQQRSREWGRSGVSQAPRKAYSRSANGT